MKVYGAAGSPGRAVRPPVPLSPVGPPVPGPGATSKVDHAGVAGGGPFPDDERSLAAGRDRMRTALRGAAPWRGLLGLGTGVPGPPEPRAEAARTVTGLAQRDRGAARA